MYISEPRGLQVISLRPYQSKVIEDCRTYFRQGIKEVLVVAPVGCVAGDTVIRLNRNGKGYKTTIEKEYQSQFDIRRNNSKSKIRSMNIDKGWVGLGNFDEIVFSGLKDCVELVSKTKSVILTPDHLVLTKDGYVQAQNMLGKEWFVDNPSSFARGSSKVKYKDKKITHIKYHPFARICKTKRSYGVETYKSIELHRFIYEAHKNKLSEKEYKYILNNDEPSCKNLFFVDPKVYEIHHINGDHFDNRPENLTHLTIAEHRRFHSQKNIKNFNQGVVFCEEVTEIKNVGQRRTYDVINSDTQNFTANDVVVHNCGKTVIAAFMMREAKAKGLTIWFVVHKRELVSQSLKAVKNIGLTCGIVGTGYPLSPREQIQIVSLGSLKTREHKVKSPDMIIYDEAHHCMAKSWLDLYNKHVGKFQIGLTASPVRLDRKGLGHVFKAMVKAPEIKELTDMGNLSKYKAYAKQLADTDSIKKSMGDFDLKDFEKNLEKSFTSDVVKEYITHLSGKRAILFAPSLERSREFVANFIAHGVSAAHLDGDVSSGERDKIISDLESGRTLVVCNFGIISEGFNCPGVEGVILARPTMSLSLYIQMCGRALRPAPNKEYAVILDHVGNILRHGLIDDEREWTLADTPKKSKKSIDEMKVKVCQKCFAANISFNKYCENCAEPFPILKRESEFKVIDESLVEIDKKQLSIARKKEQASAQTLEQLIELGKKKGYKPGWAQYIFNSRKSRRR